MSKPVATAVTMVEVVAPSDMEEGSTFDAVYDGKVFPVRVPEGGVRAGETMNVPFDGPLEVVSAVPSSGRWKDDVCGCCVFGLCHPHCCLSWWMTPCALAQVMTRLKLSWCGTPASESVWRHTFRTIAVLTGVVYITILTLYILAVAFQPRFETDDDDYPYDDDYYREPTINPVAAAYEILILSFFIFMVVILVRTRGQLRKQEGILGDCCADCCCSFWCCCCVTAQLARQTHDYVDDPVACCSADCFSATGVPPPV